jgi:hypothetical protein
MSATIPLTEAMRTTTAIAALNGVSRIECQQGAGLSDWRAIYLAMAQPVRWTLWNRAV